MNISLKNTLKMSIKSILGNKMRTFLTMLGIIIGVFSVIVMVSMGQGATASVTQSIEGMGTNLLNITLTDRTVRFSNDNLRELSMLEGVHYLSPNINWAAPVKYGLNNEAGISVVGVNENYLAINGYAVQLGRSINPLDIDNRNKVVLIGSELSKSLFGQFNPIGESISLSGIKYMVIGVLEEKESTLFGSNNNMVLIPYTTGMRQFRTNTVSSITVQGTESESIDQTQNNIEAYLLTVYGTDSYRIFNQEQLLSTLNEVTGVLTLLLGGIAGISLLVGGIGIMNIMLVTVSERTREIGVRKAIGARRSNILFQFLIESSVISGIGGIIGIMLGILVNRVISGAFGLPISASVQVIMVAFLFSLFVGVFFGIYPANKASKLKPVDALRYE
ncbi:MAG TPA: ABC transporter permease [Clostridiales bacterium]|nr:ABC transporter permease [Clostridiales bacterium]